MVGLKVIGDSFVKYTWGGTNLSRQNKWMGSGQELEVTEFVWRERDNGVGVERPCEDQTVDGWEVFLNCCVYVKLVPLNSSTIIIEHFWSHWVLYCSVNFMQHFPSKNKRWDK